MPRLLIINADDLGYDPAVSRGIAEALKKGIVSSATLMVNGPDAKAAAALAAGRDLGLHLNLARWAPLSRGFPARWLSGGELDEALAAVLSASVVEAEALAQLERFEALRGLPPTHLDVHKHLHRNAAVLEGLAAAARARGLPVRSIDPVMRARLRQLGVRTNDAFIGDAGAEPYWTLEQLRVQLEALSAGGVTELMCHPGYAPSQVRSGYAAQREIELATFLDPAARALIAQHGLTLVSWRAI